MYTKRYQIARNVVDGGDRGAVQVARIVARLDELALVDLAIHVLARDEVVLASIQLALTTGARRILIMRNNIL